MGWIGETIDASDASASYTGYSALICVTDNESSVGVVISGSMEPDLKRGDILLMHMSKEPIRVGKIVVFKVEGRHIPILHRVIMVHEKGDSGEVGVLTKGDNSPTDDTSFYGEGQLWLHRHDIMGRAVGYLPYVGWFNRIMSEKPIIMYIIGVVLALLV